jgi:hypothetical protein
VRGCSLKKKSSYTFPKKSEKSVKSEKNTKNPKNPQKIKIIKNIQQFLEEDIEQFSV